MEGFADRGVGEGVGMYRRGLVDPCCQLEEEEVVVVEGEEELHL